MLHQLTTTTLGVGRTECITHAQSGLVVCHPTDALARMCRALVVQGLTGAAEMRGTDGKLRYRVADIDYVASRMLSEGGATPIRWGKHQENPFAAARA